MLDCAEFFLYSSIMKRHTKVNMLEQLIETYNTWIAQQGLPAMSADELAWEDCVNAEQRKWLLSFCKEWEVAEEMY